MPIIQLIKKEIKFGKLNIKREVSIIDTFEADIEEGLMYDFWILVRQNEILIGVEKQQEYYLFGQVEYDDLIKMNYIGFSSIEESYWTLERSKP